MSGERRVPILASVTPGLSLVASMFALNVRQRAAEYVGRGLVRVLTSSEDRLIATVRGTETYTSAYGRRGEELIYGCSCPFFQDRLEPCKHLWALALEASNSPLVLAAQHVKKRRAVAELPFQSGAAPHEGAADDDELEDEVELHQEEPPSEPSASDSLHWQAFLEGAERLVHAHRSGQLELFYFIEPELERASFSLTLGRRKLGGRRAGALLPAERMEGRELVHAADRRLHAQLFEAPESDFLRYRTWARHRIGLNAGLSNVLLPELARSGRCRVVPKPLGPYAISWRYFRQSSRIPKSVAEEIPPFDAFLDWPLLGEDPSDEPWQLELGFERNGARKSTLQVVASLVRADERKPLVALQYLNGEGLALVDGMLGRCEKTDTPLARSLALAPQVEVPQGELADFIAASDRVCPASRLVLPEGQALVSAGAPTPVLSLGKPVPGGVPATLTFDYDGQRVDPDEHHGGLLPLSDGRWFRRHLAAEGLAREKLGAVGFSGDLLPEKKLGQALHELLRSGFQVFAEGKRYRSASGIKVRLKSGVDWFELEGGADFEGMSLELPDLLRGLKHRRLAVELGDGSFGLLPEEWIERWGLLALATGEKSKKLRLSTRQIGLLDLIVGSLPVEASKETLSRLRERLERFARVEPAQPPQSFQGELRPYQEQGLGWLRAMAELGFGACLADDMGLGKTVQVLAHLAQVHGPGSKPQGPTLIVVPRSLVNNWLSEAQRFAPKLRVHVHWGSQRSNVQQWPEADVVITTYALLRLDAETLAQHEFECIVLDEAQAIKNATSATAKAAKLMKGRQRLALTGTPVENHLGELWSLFDFLNPALLTELPAVRQLVNRAKPVPGGYELIRHVVRPFVLRRTKGEVARDLPERIEQTLYVDLDDQERSEYDQLVAHYRTRIGKKQREVGPEQSTAHVLEALLRLRQAACHPGLLDEDRRHESSSKVLALLEQLESLREEGHKALVFSQFTSLLGIVKSKLEEAGVSYEYLDGSTRDRDERIARFQGDPSISVFLISLKAGGVGLNLTAADYVFILDPWWNPAAEAQAIDRTHRIGQHRNVIAYRLLSRGTVEERVAELQASKRALVSALMDDTQNLSGNLTRKDLEALLDLGKER